MNIEANILEYLNGSRQSGGIKPTERYASFDYCFNYFQAFKEQNRLSELVSPEYVQTSCLQLGFYLASWGMFRGAAFLLQKSIKVYEPVIKVISETDPALWKIDANCYSDENISILLQFKNVLAETIGDRVYLPSDILISKIMIGVFGNVPAFDTYFKTGFSVSTFGRKALEKVRDFYETNQEVIEKYRRPTFDFLSGKPTHRLYTRAKVIDMIFFIEGNRSGRPALPAERALES